MEIGRQLLKQEAYDQAAEVFSKSENEQKTQYFEYAKGWEEVKNGNYEAAGEHFSEAGQLEDAEQMAGTMVYAAKLQTAENYWSDGRLNSAQKAYEELPEDFVFEGVSVADRLALLKKYSAFAELCGVWNCDEMRGSVRKTDTNTGTWSQWNATGQGYKLYITCKINDDDTVTIDAAANFWRFIGYSENKQDLHTTADSIHFSDTVTEVPSILTQAYSNSSASISATLWISEKYMRLEYTRKETSILSINSNTYTANGTYDVMQRAY